MIAVFRGAQGAALLPCAWIALRAIAMTLTSDRLTSEPLNRKRPVLAGSGGGVDVTEPSGLLTANLSTRLAAVEGF